MGKLSELDAMGDSISRRLKSLLTKVREKQPRDDVALTVWIENRDLIYRGLKSKDTDTCCTACEVIATMTCEEDAQWFQRAVWDDTEIRIQVVNLMVPAPCPAAVNSLCFVPWQKWAARIIANCASDEETAKKMAQDGQTLNAIICSTSDVRPSKERENSLEALANLAAVEVNRDQLWANVTLRDHILQAVSPVKRGCRWKPIRLAACEALWNFAIDGQLCEDMADDEKLLPFWEFCVKRGLSDERRDDKFHSFAQSTLSKMSGVEITGERTKQERDDEKRNAAIDLDEAVAGESSSSPASPPKRRKAQARVEGSQLPTRVAEAARLLAATGEPGPSAPPPSAPPPSAPAGSPFAGPTSGSDDELEAAVMEVAAKKMEHDEAAKELIKRSEARMQSIAAARRKVADSEAARQQAEAKAKADSQVLADLLADDCGVGELDARLKQLKSEKDIALAKVKALS
jgi:hypothetical protein